MLASRIASIARPGGLEAVVTTSVQIFVSDTTKCTLSATALVFVSGASELHQHQ